MADTQVHGSIINNLDQSNNLWGPYWIDKDTGAMVFISSGNEAFRASTTNAGANWSTQAIIFDETVTNVACWFDRETPGDSGNLIHVVTLDTGGNCKYRDYNISTATRGTQRTIATGLTVSSTKSQNRLAVTKTVSGNLIVAYSTQAEIGALKSDDNFATAGTSIADPFETGTEEDWLLLYPANTGDDNDAAGIFLDRSANEISLKMYDDSADSWTETAISNMSGSEVVYMNYDGAIRHSDNHLLIAYHVNNDSVSDDLETWDLMVDSISTPTITAKTNIFTAQSGSAQVAVLINQQNDDVYVAYLKGGTWLSSTDVVFHKSEDGMDTWGSEQAYNETTDDYRLVHGGRTVGDSGGRIQWTWYDDDSTDIWVNLVNDIEISAFVNMIDETDTTTLSDSLNLIEVRQVRLITESDTSILSDSLTTKLNLNRLLQDTSTLSDNLALEEVRASRIITESDTTTITDNLVVVKVGDIIISETDTTTLSDSLSTTQVRVPRLINESDTSTLSDSLSIDSIRESRLINESDTTTLSDSLAVIKVGDRLINESDTTNLSDSLTISRSAHTLTFSETDTTNLSDSLVNQSIFSIELSDSSNLSDSLTNQVLFNLAISDTANFSDVLVTSVPVETSAIEKYIFVLNDEVRKLNFD